MAELTNRKGTEDLIVGKIHGAWRCDGRLGSGAFGIIHVWSNIKDDLVEKITTKQLKLSLDDPTGQKRCEERWCQEVKTFSSLCHENVVRVFELPPDLKLLFTAQSSDASISESPVLCMEFCDNGSLRNILNRTENVYGMSENECLTIVMHVTSGLEYLHQRRITHRNLRPENVVSKLCNTRNHDGNKESTNLYKLIDLGLAKEIGPNGISSSSNGPLEYTAPELFTSENYDKTVDFWSLGVMAFEIITGTRPFFHDNKTPKVGSKDWINLLSKKSHETISIAFSSDSGKLNDVSNASNQKSLACADTPSTTNKTLKNLKSLDSNNRLSVTLKNDFSVWLQLLLEIDPQKRGQMSIGKSRMHDHDGPYVFTMAYEILSKTRIKIYSIDLTYNDVIISDSTISAYYQDVRSFEMAVGRTLRKPFDQLLILTSSGTILDSNEKFSTFVTQINEGKEVDRIYAYDLQFDSKSNIQGQRPKLSPSMLAMLKNPKHQMDYDSKLLIARQIYFFIRQEIQAMEYLDDTTKKFVQNLLQADVTSISSMQEDIDRLSEKTKDKLELFIESLSYDVNRLSEMQETLSTPECLSAWENNRTELQNKMKILFDKRARLCTASNGCKIVFEEIHGTSFDFLDFKTFESQIYRNVEHLKIMMKDEVSIENNVLLAQLLAKFLKRRDILLEKSSERYRKMLDNYTALENLKKSQCILKEEYEICLTTITKYQLRRQMQCWNMLKHVVNKQSTPTNEIIHPQLNLTKCDFKHEIESSKHLISKNTEIWNQLVTVMNDL